MKKSLLTFFLFIFFVCFIVNKSFAIATDGSIWGWWGYTGNHGVLSWAADFIIAGDVGKNGPHGTWNDEWGIVSLVAIKVVEHGAYFCPYQIQCANKRKAKEAWTVYYLPVGFSNNKCAWLCEPGFTGENCVSQTKNPAYCDNALYNTSAGGKFSGLSMKTYGGDDTSVEGNVHGFESWWEGDKYEYDVVLGVTKFLSHGVMASPVRVHCGRTNWKDNDSHIDGVYYAPGKTKLLCAPGYTAEEGDTDCKPINEDVCLIQGKNFCSNFSKEKYDPSIHTVKEVNNCVKYFCAEPGTAFTSVDDTKCIKCADGSKGGSNPDDGTCIVCDTGEVFNSDTGVCENAEVYSKNDLQYGKGKTRNNSGDLKDQCWTIFDTDGYVNCVTNKKTN